MTTTPLPLAVLASGRGSNLQALMHAQQTGKLPVDFRLVASDRAHAPALRHAEAAGIPTLALDPGTHATRRAYDMELFTRLADSGAQLIVLAGFMRILDAQSIAPWRGRIINVHPSLLPLYRGLHTHRRALENGDTEHGASVHFVTAELDGGPIIAQARIDVHTHDTEQSLAERLLPREHRLLTTVTALIANDRLRLGASGIELDGLPLQQPLQLQADLLQGA